MAQGTNYMTTHKSSIALYLQAPHDNGFETDQYGNFIYKSTDTADTGYWHMDNNDKSVSMRYYWNTGDLWVPGKLGVGYNPATSGNTYKLYVDGSECITGNIILSGESTSSLKKIYTNASTMPAIIIGSNNKDVNLIRVYSSDGNYADTSVYGFNLRYLGTGGGVDNQLAFFADNQAGTEIRALSINQNGQIGIKAAANSSYSLYVNGTSCFTSAVTLSGTDSSTAQINFSRTGVQCPNYINAPASAEFGFSIGGVAGANIRLHITNTTVDSWTNNSVSLGTSAIRWSGIYSTTGNFSDNVTIASGKRIGCSGGSLYLGNSGNESWVYVQDIASQTSTDNWKITQSGTGNFKLLNVTAGELVITQSNAALGIATSSPYKIGTAKWNIHIKNGNGSGTGVNDGYASAITFGDGSAYAGIYYQSSGSYGSRLIFGTTNSYANGVYGRVIIDHEGKVGIGTMSPGYKLEVNGTSYFSGAVSVPSTLTVRAKNTTTEGGQICLAADPNHSSYPAYLDVCNNYFRVHSNGQERFTVNLSSYGTSKFNGLLQITKNSNTVTIGSANTSWCHFDNSANIPFYFGRAVHVNGDVYYYNTKVHMSSSGFHPPKNGGIYWDPYVESASDASDVTSIYQIASGVAGGTELRINQQNDATDVINLCTNSHIYMNSKKAFSIYDSWLRINEDKGFSSGIYTGSSLIRTDNQLQVGSSGNTFLADSNGIKILNRFVYHYASIAAHSGNKAEATHWWKIANVTGYFNFTIYVSGGWNWGSPSIIVFNITQRNGTVYITQLSGLAGSNCSCVKLGKNSTNDWDLLIRTNGAGSGASHAAMQFDIIGQGGITVYRDVDTATDSTYSNGETTLDITDIYGKNITSSNIGSQSVNYAASAGSVAWANTGHPATFPPSAHSHDYLPIQNARAAYIYTNTAGAGFQPGSGSALEIREVNLVVANQSAWSYAPKIGFHWGNRVARQFGMNSAGEFCFFNQSSDSSYATIKAGLFNFNNILWTDGGAIFIGTSGTARITLYCENGAALFSNRVRVNYGQDVSVSGKNGAFIVGNIDGENIGMDGNEIMARNNTSTNTLYLNADGGAVRTGGHMYASGFNDYAEFRKVNINEPGRVVAPNNYGSADITTERLQPGARIISDTYGFAIGDSDVAKTPLAMTGRVLVYPYRPISEYHVGDVVCSAPNGTVDIMTREEIKEYPDRIIGIVNEIPNYAVWKVRKTRDDDPRHYVEQSTTVRGRIWVDVK